MIYKINEMSDDVIVIDCPPRLDVNVSDELKKIMSKLIEDEKYKIVLNLTDTRYVDSSGLGAIVSRIAVSRSNGGDVRIATTSRLILDLLNLTNLNKIISRYDDIISAVNSF